jgi:hypothetical protein
MNDKSLLDIYFEMFRRLKPNIGFEEACSKLNIDNMWKGDKWTAIRAIELFITFANQQVSGKTTYVFGGEKSFRQLPIKEIKKIQKNNKKCRKNSLVKVK